MAALKVGDKVPSFSLYDQDSNSVSIDTLVGTTNLVIYFYPKDNTPGCTREACQFRDNIADFNDLEAKVIGISSDNVQSHKNFALKHNLNFTLLSDEGGEIRKVFGVKSDFLGLIDGRTTYVIDLEGTIIHVFESQLNPAKHVKEALAALAQ